MSDNFGLGQSLRGKTLGIWNYGRIGKIVAGYGGAFGMRVLVWGGDVSRAKTAVDGSDVAASKQQLFEDSDVLSLHRRLH